MDKAVPPPPAVFSTAQQLRRRGLMAGIAALAAGTLTKMSPRVAEAADGNNLIIGSQTNSATSATALDRNGAAANVPTLILTNNNSDGLQSIVSGTLSYGVLGDNSAGFGVVGTSSSGTGVSGGSTSGTGVSGDSNSSTGVAGFSDTGPGVHGSSTAAGSTQPGVAGVGTAGSGVSGSSTSSAGVSGTSNSGSGVSGTSTSGQGVRGSSSGSYGVWGNTTSSDPWGIGVYGSNPSGVGVYGSSSTRYGVVGTASGTGALGVYGYAANGTGLYGETAALNYNGVTGINDTTTTGLNQTFGVAGRALGGANAIGVYGLSNAGIGAWGRANASGGVGVYGSAVSGAKAAVFDGEVVVNGPFTVNNPNKSAAVPHPDGSLRRLYCQESPEPWFEDFGSGTLAAGRAGVTLDQDFAAVVATEGYRVFVTPEGDCKGLYVTGKTVTGFEVRELQGGSSNLPFSYRVVAKRKDATGQRLERVVPTRRPPEPTAIEKPVAPVVPSLAPLDVAVPAPVQAPARDQRRGTPSSDPRR